MEPFLGEIRLFPYNAIPKGWAACEGQILQINMNQALYSILSNVYGGDGRTTFALPDYRGRTPIHVSTSIPLGTSQGEASHTLTVNEIPQHTHQVFSSPEAPKVASPNGNTWSAVADSFSQNETTAGTTGGNATQMAVGSIKESGSSSAHDNMQPYLVLVYAIATTGIYPSRG
ncbi:phage tail protein [Paenibacillus massiliensis]|uniref:phage tail protein n=1 Tax=Paenibacillus massiliensis TaxID=225917 RepID=UPI00041CD2DD|nr:tail fiber protein [Paenibacillus massiliensis]